MSSEWLSGQIPIIIFALSLVTYLYSVFRHPARLSNSFLLFLMLILALPAAVSLFGESGAVIALLFVVSFVAATLLAPILLIWNGLVMLKRESGRLANLLSLLLGFAIAAGEIAFLYSVLKGEIIPEGVLSSIGSALIWMFGFSVFYFSVLLLAFVLHVLLLPLLSRKGRFDTVIVHGCALIHGDKVSKILANRLDLALELYHKSGDKALLVVSGGQGDDETVSEAEAMARYLLERGVPEERILREDKSRSTEENLLNTMRLLSGRGEAGSLALVTSGYHLYRCLLIAKRLGVNCKGFGAKVAAYYWPSAVIREFAAVFSQKPHLTRAAIGYVLLVVLPIIDYLIYLL